MKKIDKTKEVLLRELNSLKQENAALKAMYEKDILECKRVEEVMQEEEQCLL